MPSLNPGSMLFAVALLAGCSSGSDADRPAAKNSDKALLEAARKPLEKAGQVEQQVLDAAEAERRKAAEAEQ